MEEQDYKNDPHSFYLPLNNDGRGTIPSASEALQEDEKAIAEAFANEGFFVLRESFDTDVLLPFREFANAYFAKCFEDLCDHGHIEAPLYRRRKKGLSDEDYSSDNTAREQQQQQQYTYTLQQGIQHGFREIVMRSPGRYELSLLHFDRKQTTDHDDEIDDNNNNNNNQTKTSFDAFPLGDNISRLVEPLKSLLPRLVGPNYATHDELKLCHLSLLIATPGSSDQSWHADGGHANVSKHLPCHCFNVFFPLQDTPRVLGPTELRPASHFLTRNLGPMMLAARCRKALKAPVWPELAFGDAIVLDYRVLHRGRANLSGGGDASPAGANGNTTSFPAINRNYLVLSYSEPWFQDILNFPKRSMYDRTQDLVDANA